MSQIAFHSIGRHFWELEGMFARGGATNKKPSPTGWGKAELRFQTVRKSILAIGITPLPFDSYQE